MRLNGGGWCDKIKKIGGVDIAGWKYKLEALGKSLRTSIDEDDSIQTINLLRECCQKIIGMLCGRDKEYYSDRFEELYNLMDGEAETLENDPDDLLEWGFTDENDLVNARLREFYDLCDGCRVWIGLGF